MDIAVRFTKRGTISVTGKESISSSSSKYSEDSIDAPNNNKNRVGKFPEEIMVKVKDSGRGLNLQSFPKLIPKFFSIPGTGGTGLGLYISKAIIGVNGDII